MTDQFCRRCGRSVCRCGALPKPRNRLTTIAWPRLRLVWGCWIVGGGAPGFGGWVVCLGPLRIIGKLPQRKPKKQKDGLGPVLTPLRNEIPRVTGKAGIMQHWRERKAEAAAQPTTEDYVAAYKATGIEDTTTDPLDGPFVKPATPEELRAALTLAMKQESEP